MTLLISWHVSLICDKTKDLTNLFNRLRFEIEEMTLQRFDFEEMTLQMQWAVTKIPRVVPDKIL